MMWWKPVALLLVCWNFSIGRSLNIALHAQLIPTTDKIVGSVITTNGLKLAFQGRSEVNLVDIFYPAHYSAYLNHTWDVVLIEGWFPSIDQFIVLTRNNFPKTRIVFISLDPIYPGKDIVRDFDLDGLLTNSEELVQFYEDIFPSESMLLAADVNVMRPFPNISREYGAVYIGAGGNMLEYKPELYHLLVSAIQYGLRLHGNAWEGVPVLKEVTQGGLPQLELARAYASAHVVLASTIDAQSQYRMINNRIFEALACGSLVVTKYAEELAALRCEALLLTNDTHSLHTYMEKLQQQSPGEIARLRQSGRDFVVSKHTWSHRAVQILDFYHRMGEASVADFSSSREVCRLVHCMRANCPKMLWLVSPHLLQHQDYLQVSRTMAPLHLCRVFSITTLPASAVTAGDIEVLRKYDYILSFVTPFDKLDVAMRSLPLLSKPAPHQLPPILQKRAAYLIGYDSSLVGAYLTSDTHIRLADDFLTFRHYDSVWYRSAFEVELLASLSGGDIASLGRMQEMFGLGTNQTSLRDNKRTAEVSSEYGSHMSPRAAQYPSQFVIVCMFPHFDLCIRSNRDHFLRMYNTEKDVSNDLPHTILLIGGTWDAWLSHSVGIDGMPLLTDLELRSVVHVREGRTGDAVRILQSASTVVILNPTYGDFSGIASLRECLAAASGGVSADMIGRTLLCLRAFPLDTTGEELWSLVAAAVSSARIHLLNSSPQLMSVAHGGCGDWDEGAFVTMVRTGMNRVLGLGSIHTHVMPSRVIVAQDDKSTLHCLGNCSTRDSALASSLVSSNSASSIHSLDEVPERVLIIRLDYDQFYVGRDGECCIHQEFSVDGNFTTSEDFPSGTQIPGDKICLMRPYQYVIVKLRQPVETFLCKKGFPLQLTVTLRGSFFGDPFYTVKMKFHSFDSILLPAPIVWSNEWLSQHNAYVYTASYC